jgi:hypothetical protein
MAKSKKKDGQEDRAAPNGEPGTLHRPGSLMLRNHVGSAENPETGVKYVTSTNFGDWRPIIHSEKTGVSFSLSWQDLINIAVAAGIDKEWK